MRLLIAIINNPANVFYILDEFYQEGIKGSTVLDSMGMAHIMAHHVPFFAKFTEEDQEPGQNKTIFVLIRSDEERERVIGAIERIVGDLNQPDTGVVLTIPVEFCKGAGQIFEDCGSSE
ncbi:hypothetical protein SAMN05192551_101529 [Tindallia magadiensis]|uniref:Nitrogen regulatory protein P-II family n=1 Tax=Tindallia magadiensis TaxID=69895 RepID=A0A1I3B1P8_9FIRM|nr:hypothetical protein [Tindallia magadiensis]SFH56224.1 hypothetical protein SAMN05192551_101529 [Tindallia magadiensis]